MIPPRPSIGSLRRTISIQRQRKVSDGMGSLQGAWQTLLTGLRARISPLKGTEEVIAARLQGTGTYNVVVRRSSATVGITSGDRIVDDTGAIYNIRFVANFDERNRFLTLLAETGVVT